MRVLRNGSEGRDVEAWQTFLDSKGYDAGTPDGEFGNMTAEATKKFQSDHGLGADGIVGAGTYTKAAELGFTPPADLPSAPTGGSAVPAGNHPPPPPFPQLSGTRRGDIFGTFAWQPAQDGNITITDGWDSDNIVRVSVPQLKDVPYYNRGNSLKNKGDMRVHKKAAEQVQGFFAEVEKQGLLGCIVTYEGAFVPRYIRGSKNSLSNHSWGTAFDLNAYANGLNQTPAARGKDGCLFDLVSVAHQYGFYWGGHFSRRDGMHFEIAKLL